MKIAFIYSYRDGEVWSTPYSIAAEFQTRGWDVEIFSLLSTTDTYTDAGIQMMLDQINAQTYSPDIIVYMDWGRFDSPLLDHLLYPSAFWVQEAGDEPQNHDRNAGKSFRFDLTLCPDYQSTEKYKAMGINAIWWTHFADSVIYKPVPMGIKYDVVSTRGYGSSGILDRLQHEMGSRMYNQNGTIGIAHSEALQRGKIVVQHSRYKEITRRIFEAMAGGRMVMADRLSIDTHIDDIFRENQDIIYYDNYEDLRRKLDHYIFSNTEREKIAMSGKKTVMKGHTQVQRVDTILKEFRKWKSSQ